MADYKNKFIDYNGLKWLWRKIVSLFVMKDGDKVLTDNNFSDEDAAKLNGIEDRANFYELPKASGDTLGGVKVGDGLAMNADGTLSVTDRGGGGAYTYRGRVETAADLQEIVNPQNGDTYDCKEDGMNYTWNASEERWDEQGPIVSALTTLEIDIITGAATDESAFRAILEGQSEVLLNEDIVFNDVVVIDKDFVIDLGNSDISTSISDVLFKVDGCTLTLKGVGSINASNIVAEASNGGKIVIEGGHYSSKKKFAFSSLGDGSKITMNGGIISAQEGGIGAFDGGEIVVNDGMITIDDNFALFTNGTKNRGGNKITVNGGTLIGNISSAGYEAIGVYIANNDTFVMNDGEIIANNGAGLCMRGGDVTINGGSITATGEAGTTGKIGDDATMMSKSAVIYHQTAHYPGSAGMKLTITGGKLIGVDHAIEILSDEAEPNVSVTGGAFTPDYPEE